MSMNSQIVCGHALNLIVQRGTRQVRDNRTIKKHLQNFIASQSAFISNDMLGQAGAIVSNPTPATQNQSAPSSAPKDTRCYRSLKSTAKRPISSQEKISEQNGNIRRSKISTYSANSKIRKSNKQSKFIDLSAITQTNARRITQGMRQQEQNINKMRKNKENQQERDKKQRDSERAAQRQKRERVLEKHRYMQKFMKNKDNSFTYESDGSMLFFAKDYQTEALRRKYPPKAPQASFEYQQDPINPNQFNLSIKQKAARGQAFASAVLKTINMSKISLNLTTNLDEHTFMQRNDLFNNNHCRQTTTIPYLKVNEGTSFTEPHTNLSVSKKSTYRTCHSETKSKFNKHSFLQKENQKEQNVEPVDDSGDKKRAQSSRPYVRPKSCIPQTARTAGRITTVNKNLAEELIE